MTPRRSSSGGGGLTGLCTFVPSLLSTQALANWPPPGTSGRRRRCSTVEASLGGPFEPPTAIFTHYLFIGKTKSSLLSLPRRVPVPRRPPPRSPPSTPRAPRRPSPAHLAPPPVALQIGLSPPPPKICMKTKLFTQLLPTIYIIFFSGDAIQFNSILYYYQHPR